MIDLGELCFPVESWDITVQNNYNLDKKGKWKLVYKLFENQIPFRSSEDIDECEIYYPNDPETKKYYEKTNKDVLSINFMNVAAGKLSGDIYDLTDYLNGKLSDFRRKV